MPEKPLLDADAAQAVLAHYLMKHENRDIVTLRLQITGVRWATGTTGPDRPFFFFEAGENDGWYVHRDDSSVEPDDACPKPSKPC